MDTDKFAPRVDGIKQEKLGIRPTDYSEWHRSNLGPECVAHDLDFIEVRNGQIAGLFSITGNLNDKSHLENSKKYIYQRSSFWREVQSMRDLCKGKEFKGYYVLHTKDMKCFEVWNVIDNEEPTWEEMNEEQYKAFMEGLGHKKKRKVFWDD